jgi:hypothetical protein
MAECTEKCKKLFEMILQKLVSSKQITATRAYTAKTEFLNFLQTIVKKNLLAFQDYQVDETRLDDFFMQYFEETVRFPNFVEIVKFVMILSHGQSAVERGFSINKSLLVENLQERSLIAQRIVLDHMNAHQYKPFNVPISKELLLSS